MNKDDYTASMNHQEDSGANTADSSVTINESHVPDTETNSEAQSAAQTVITNEAAFPFPGDHDDGKDLAAIEVMPAGADRKLSDRAGETEKSKKEKRDYRRRTLMNELEQKERELERLQDDYAKLSLQYAELKDRHLRLAAEMENFRKRLERDFSNRVENAVADLLAELLPVVDDLERFFNARQGIETEVEVKDGEALVAGVRLIYQNLMKILQNRGVTAMQAVGQEFDPTRHEAILQMPVEGEASNIVVHENTKGYLFFDKVLRPAKVIVSA
ncbi:MAG: nucleotide exchange factor GrpE [candidate division KSB1 bacterium]|nr:nucleotide exchange factor GrpE [candidate division KSB1 bacterium]MDZ7304091.1 nucleotide exchange factor GrpE [candidate division KSB1 bacterium]MDZ7312071.1 nucleotide exchange factor GrpE [candidate division KSB1 bacterium]